MFGKDDLMDNLSRGLDRARGRRDTLASEITTLTAQIAEMEGRLSEEKTRRERDHSLGEIEATKQRIKHATSEFAPMIRELSEAIERVAAVVPEAGELNNFLLSVAAEVDSVVDVLLRELDRRAAAIRAGQAVMTLPCLANGVPPEGQRNNGGRFIRFTVWQSLTNEIEKNETKVVRSDSVNHKCNARMKTNLDVLLQHCTRHAAASIANLIVNKLAWGKRENALVTPACNLDPEIAGMRDGLLDNGVTASTERRDALQELDQ